MRQTVSAILISTDNEFILMQRDDKPNIASPGKIANFGGTVEVGETPLDAIIREIQEELSIKLNKDDIESLGSSIRTSDLDSKDRLAHLFVTRNIKKGDLVLREGQGIVYLKYNDPLESLNLSSGTKETLTMFKNMKK